MGKITARNAFFRVWDGTASTVLSQSLNNITLTMPEDAPEISVFATQNRERMTEGIKDWEMSVDGYIELGAGEIDEVLFGLVGGACCMVDFGPSTSAASAVKYTGSAVLQSYEMTFTLEDAATLTANFQARTGSLTRTTF